MLRLVAAGCADPDSLDDVERFRCVSGFLPSCGTEMLDVVPQPC